MNYTDKITIDYLREILELLKQPAIKDFILIIIGGFIGFFGTYIIYRLNRHDDFNNSLEKIVIELNILTEEIRHNIFTIREEGYLYKYYYKEAELMIKSGNYLGQNNGVVMAKSDKLDIRLRDRELLSAKLSGLIQRHNLAISKLVEIDTKFNEYINFDVLPKYFEEFEDLDKLHQAFDKKYIENQKNELSKNFEPLLFGLVNEIKKSIYKKLNKKDLLREFESTNIKK
jgi:hypothetical protein